VKAFTNYLLYIPKHTKQSYTINQPNQKQQQKPHSLSMDFHLKQWRNQHESEQQHSAKIPKLLLEPQQQPQSSASAALPLFVPEPNTKISPMSAFPDSTSAATRFPSKISFPFSCATETLKALCFFPESV
jgi:lipopolysaccharide export LptBFGC system permease protein LptF